MLRKALVEELAESGFNVLEAESVEDVLEIMRWRGDDVDAIFTDINMPGCLSGLDLARIANQNWPWISVLISSGSEPPNQGEMPIGSRFLRKPYELPRVAALMTESLQPVAPTPNSVPNIAPLNSLI